MTGVHAVVAVKGLDRGKYRLAGALTETQRHLLITTMLGDVIEALRATQGIASVYVLSGDRAVLPDNVEHIDDPGAGLNAAVSHAARVVSTAGGKSMLVLSADLPFVTADDIGALLAAAKDHDAVIAPDARHTGTNALLLAPPHLIVPQFGEQSFTAHVRAVRSIARTLKIVARPGLARDIDVPADLLASSSQLGPRYRFLDAESRKAS